MRKYELLSDKVLDLYVMDRDSITLNVPKRMKVNIAKYLFDSAKNDEIKLQSSKIIKQAINELALSKNGHWSWLQRNENGERMITLPVESIIVLPDFHNEIYIDYKNKCREAQMKLNKLEELYLYSHEILFDLTDEQIEEILLHLKEFGTLIAMYDFLKNYKKI